MGNKKEKSKQILTLIEEFNSEFGEGYDVNKSISCTYGIELEALEEKKEAVKNVISSKVRFSIANSTVTFAIIKPNALKNKVAADIIADIEAAGLSVFAANLKTFTREEAVEFYAEHKGKFFVDELIDFMISGPVITLILEKEENAVQTLRHIMGPVEAINDKVGHANTLRAKYADSMTENSVHGSDSDESFEREMLFF